MKLNIQTVTQEALFSDLSDEGDMESLFQILVSCKCYMNFKIVCIVIDYTQFVQTTQFVYYSFIMNQILQPSFLYHPGTKFHELSF